MVKPTRVAIAADSPDTILAGSMLAEQGGNVVDIAVATALAAAHTEILMCSLGGSAFINLKLPGQDAEIIDGGDAMPNSAVGLRAEDASWRQARIPYGDGITVNVGHGSVAIPGMLSALETAWQRHGSLPWREIVAPAIHFAREGATVNQTLAAWLDLTGEIVFSAQPHSRDCFFPGGNMLRAGDCFTVPDYLASLELIAEEGARAFYAGDISMLIAREVRDNGGHVSRDDLAGYTASVRKPILLDSAGYSLALNPPPSIGGAMLGSMLSLYQAELPGNASEAEKVLLKSRIQRMLFSLRHDESAAGWSADSVSKLLEVDWLRQYLHKLFSPTTNHMSFATADGAVVSITMSMGYGAGVTIPGTGITCNNTLGEPELNPQGFFQIPAGGKFVSNMSPVTACNCAGSSIAMGSPGASRIATCLFQGWINFAFEDMNAKQATRAPRFHVENIDDVFTLQHEPGIDTSLATELFRLRPFTEPDMYFGALNIAGRDASGELFVSADSRRHGAELLR
ncbi:MAG: gamma-glutamyltransferase [Gammaproteobacteria bacterium]|nr:gamma-glutamyltransferase [Gammaproteobacteria bacterium]